MNSGIAFRQSYGMWPVRDPVAANDEGDELFVLRSIGWNEWDPLGLNGAGQSDAADDYDPYLVRVVRGLRDGEPEAAMVDYLLGAETYHMRRLLTSDTRVRARATVAAIQDYLRSVH